MNARHMEAGRKRLASRMPLAWPALFAAVVFLLAALRIASGQAGEVFQDCSVCPQMIVVPAGRFMMGSPESEKYRHDEEGPVREVTIPRAFAVGVYEVTNGELRECVNEGSCDEWYFVGTRRHAAYIISRDDAQLYVQWLSARTGAEYRLLSEAEWEYAARAGTTTRYSFGDDIAPGDANYGGLLYYYLDSASIDGTGRNDYKRYPTVGSYAPNGFGLYDMHGGVAEWVQDCWNDNYAGAPNDGSAWEAGDCRRRVIRGGSAADSHMELRSAARSWFRANGREILIGLRVARTLAP